MEIWLGDDELVNGEAQSSVVHRDAESGTKEWMLEYTFEHPGLYDLWYRASVDGEDYRPYSPGLENAMQILYVEQGAE